MSRFLLEFLQPTPLCLKSKSCVFGTFIKWLEDHFFNLIQIAYCPLNRSFQLDLIQVLSKNSFHFINQALSLLILWHRLEYKNGEAKNDLFILLPLSWQDSLFLPSGYPVHYFLDYHVHVSLHLKLSQGAQDKGLFLGLGLRRDGISEC